MFRMESEHRSERAKAGLAKLKAQDKTLGWPKGSKDKGKRKAYGKINSWFYYFRNKTAINTAATRTKGIHNGQFAIAAATIKQIKMIPTTFNTPSIESVSFLSLLNRVYQKRGGLKRCLYLETKSHRKTLTSYIVYAIIACNIA